MIELPRAVGGVVAVPVVLAPVGGLLCDRIGARPLMVLALGCEVLAFGWSALVVHAGVGYAPLLPALVLTGAAALFFAPVGAVALSAVRRDEQGQASGAITAVRELAVVVGVAVLASVFAATGGYGSPAAFVAGFRPAMWTACGLAAAGIVAALALRSSRSSSPGHVRRRLRDTGPGCP
jgi:MFS family permease